MRAFVPSACIAYKSVCPCCWTEKAIEPSQVVIEVTGGTEVEYSNVTVTFLPPGSNHFGGEPLPGVVYTIKDVR